MWPIRGQVSLQLLVAFAVDLFKALVLKGNPRRGGGQPRLTVNIDIFVRKAMKWLSKVPASMW